MMNSRRAFLLGSAAIVTAGWRSGNPAIISTPVVTATPNTFFPNTGVSFTGTVATFTSSDPAQPSTAFNASINWGDSSSSAGTVTGSGGNYTVTGTHTYSTAGGRTAPVTITMPGFPTVTATASSTATVTDPTSFGVLTAEVAISGGSTYTFTSATATDLGNYSDPQGTFTQKCLKATNPGLQYYTVYFRPDTTSSRLEVVFEFVACFVGSGYYQILGAHTVTIKQNGTTLYTSPSLPRHIWGQRWRWQSAVRPVRRTPATLTSAGLLPAMSNSANGGFAPAADGAGYPTYAQLGDLAGIDACMCTTGNTAYLGPITSWDADYILNGTPAALTSIRAIAEAFNSYAVAFRDENTNAPLSLITFPNAKRNFSPSGSPALANDNAMTYGSAYETNFNPSHQPSCGYLLYMMTGDPYVLETMQFAANANLTLHGVQSDPNWGFYGDGLRPYTWNQRTLGQTAAATPGSGLPSWFLPKSHFSTLLTQMQTRATSLWTNPGDPIRGVLFTASDGAGFVYGTGGANITNDCAFSGFWESYYQMMLGFLVCIGLTEFMPLLTWHTNFEKARVSVPSGWRRDAPDLYWGYIRPTASTYFATMADMWTKNFTSASDPCRPVPPGGSCGTPGNGDTAHLTRPPYWDYDNAIYGGLALAKQAGVAGLDSTNVGWLQSELIAASGGGGYLYQKYSWT